MKPGLVIYVNNLKVMSDFYEKLFNLRIRETNENYVALENEQIELVLLKTETSSRVGSSNQSGFKIRESTPIKPVFIVDEPIEKIRATVKSLGSGFNSSETEWKFNGYNVCDGWDPEGNIFQVRLQKALNKLK